MLVMYRNKQKKRKPSVKKIVKHSRMTIIKKKWNVHGQDDSLPWRSQLQQNSRLPLLGPCSRPKREVLWGPRPSPSARFSRSHWFEFIPSPPYFCPESPKQHLNGRPVPIPLSTNTAKSGFPKCASKHVTPAYHPPPLSSSLPFPWSPDELLLIIPNWT